MNRLTDMKCPHCNETFPLTWKRYLGSPLGRHRCPSCGQRSRLNYGPLAMFAVVIVFALVTVPGWFIFEYWLGRPWGFAGIVLGACVILPFDKFLDERCRHLTKMDQ